MIFEAVHNSVLLNEVLSFMKDEYGIIIDGTTGEGGHSEAILSAFSIRKKHICIDIDSEILRIAEKRLIEHKSPDLIFINDNFKHIDKILYKFNIDKFDFMIADLGISTYHYFESGRGFSFHDEAPLDLRLNKDKGYPFFELVKNLDALDIERILRDYAEERFAGRISECIYENRDMIYTARDLTKIIEDSIGRLYRGKIHPATKAFMAFRIFVNEELVNLDHFLDIVPSLMNPGGRLLVISFHSIEDRIVKKAFKKYAHREKRNKYRNGLLRRDFAVNLTKKPIRPGESELRDNPKARSAKLRILEKA